MDSIIGLPIPVRTPLAQMHLVQGGDDGDGGGDRYKNYFYRGRMLLCHVRIAKSLIIYFHSLMEIW